MRAVAIYEYAPWTATSPARPLTEIVVCRVSLWHRGDFHGENVGGLLPTGLTIESSSGERSFINIDLNALTTPQLSIAAREWIVSGLQTCCTKAARLP